MSSYSAEIHWRRENQAFIDNLYSRKHTWRFDGGIEVPASSSPHVVPVPCSVEQAVDPEEAFIASLSSCHMLWFLSLAAKRHYIVDTYDDTAVGTLEKNPLGRLAITKVKLQPRVVFSGSKIPDTADIFNLHQHAHEACFIASSVLTEVTCEPRFH